MSLHGPLDRLRKMALFEKVQQSFSDAKRWLAGAGVATAAGVIAFAWAANPSDADQAAAKTKESGPTLLEPSRVSLSVDNKRQSLAPLRERLGSACDLAHVPALGRRERRDARGRDASKLTVQRGEAFDW